MKQSSTWRELHCVSFALQGFAHLFSGCSVWWFTDNQVVPLIVDCENNMEIEAELISRSLNEKADYLIKVVVYDDCSIVSLNPDALGVDSLAFSWAREFC
ncbi:unnamed protein product [Pocillopora meandrina]|uniref:Uncharacterized protein n=1 Tax=Pocillopora meandrina TaxID=46732 RepID=A0AAU9W4D7_9CNID|nr:unnamed protein product [Pocillopora meandrina]